MLVNQSNPNSIFFNSYNDTNDKNLPQELEDLEILDLFLNDLVEIHTAFDNILEKARNLNLNPLEFYKLAQQKLEAGKSLNATQLSQIETLRQYIENSLEGEDSFHILAEKIKMESPDIREYFIQNIENLTLFLARKHKEMLALPSHTKVEQEEFRHIKRTFRDLFLSVAKNFAEHNIVNKLYTKFLKNNFGRQGWSPEDDFFICLFNDSDTDSLHCFMDELLHFRKNYLCRYSMDKVIKAIEHKINQIQSDLFITETSSNDRTRLMLDNIKDKQITINDECLSLLKTTFIHGTTSSVLSKLPFSNMQLMPIGHLIRKGIIPLSGETREGAQFDKKSIKYSGISATTLDDGSRAEWYSRGYPLNKDEEKMILTSLLKTLENENFLKDMQTCIATFKWARESIAILRLRLMDEEFFNEHKEKLSEGIEKLIENFRFFKTTPEYSHFMPKYLDPDGTLGYQWHDDYYHKYTEKCQKNLDTLKQALTSPIKKEKSEESENSYPIVFGSTNIHSEFVSWKDNLERRTQKFCLLGKDFDFLSVKSDKINALKAYLKEHDLEEKIKIVGTDTLMQAFLLNSLASHYFADFASNKKMAKIFNEEPIDVDQIPDELDLSFKMDEMLKTKQQKVTSIDHDAMNNSFTNSNNQNGPLLLKLWNTWENFAGQIWEQ